MTFARACSVAALVLIAGCSREDQAATPPPPAPVAAPPPTPPPAPPALTRADLLAVVRDAASATAAGEPYPPSAAALAGRRFALRLPFGCAGPAPDASAGYAYDPRRQVLKLSVRPETWTDTPWVRELVGSPETEAIEGFWLRRPWMLTETCPVPAQIEGAPALAPGPETVGLARVFEKGASRLPRRGGRAFEATEKASPEPPPGVGGFRLVLEGRFNDAAGAGPVRCRALHPDQRPVCLVLVQVDRVAFEDSAGRQLAEWTH